MSTEKISFGGDFNGTLNSGKNQVQVALGEEGVFPYELAMTGLVSCFYSTFMDVATKKRLTWENVNIEIEWSKDKEASPQFLKRAHLDIVIEADEDKYKKFHKSFELAAKYCSLYQTFSKVAELSWELKFK